MFSSTHPHCLLVQQILNSNLFFQLYSDYNWSTFVIYVFCFCIFPNLCLCLCHAGAVCWNSDSVKNVTQMQKHWCFSLRLSRLSEKENNAQWISFWVYLHRTISPNFCFHRWIIVFGKESLQRSHLSSDLCTLCWQKEKWALLHIGTQTYKKTM